MIGRQRRILARRMAPALAAVDGPIDRIRKQERTACVNRIRGLLAEFGIVVARSTKALRAALSEVLEDGSNEMTSTYKDIKFAKPDAAQFEPPAGFTKYDNMQALQQVMMQKMMGTLKN